MMKVVATFEDDEFMSTGIQGAVSVSNRDEYAVVGSTKGNIVFFDLENEKMEEVLSSQVN